MTDNEIIKALECCSTYKGKCTDCPAFVKVDRSNCKQVLLGAIEIINRQREEIEKRERGLQFLQEAIGKNESRWLGIVAEQRAEAIKEFAKKIQRHCTSIELNAYIDTLVEETVGADIEYGAYHLDQVIPVLQRTDDYVRRALEKKKDFLLAALAALEEI